MATEMSRRALPEVIQTERLVLRPYSFEDEKNGSRVEPEFLEKVLRGLKRRTFCHTPSL